MLRKCCFHRFNFVRCYISQTSQNAHLSIKTLNDYGHYDRAFAHFDRLVEERNVNIISLLNILETCTKSSNIDRARQIERLINQSNQFKDNIRLQTSLINFYMRTQNIDQGQLKRRTSDSTTVLVFSWTNFQTHSSFIPMRCDRLQCDDRS